MYRSRAAANMSADFPSGKAPTTQVHRRLSCVIRSSGLLVRMRRQCWGGNWHSVLSPTFDDRCTTHDVRRTRHFALALGTEFEDLRAGVQ